MATTVTGTSLSFTEFLARRDTELFQQLLAESQYNEFFKDMSGSLKRAAAAVGTGLALVAGSPTSSNIFNQPSAIKRLEANPQIKAVIDHIKHASGLNVDVRNVVMVKPSDVISGEYGSDWQKVRDIAKIAQGSTTKIGDEELPRMPSAGDMSMDKLDTAVPVVFMDPSKFPGTQPGMKGFCTSTTSGQKYCVVNSPFNLHTIRHELSHTTQNTLLASSLSDDSEGLQYLTSDAEIGVRLAELKRNWYKKTGEILTRSNLGKAFKDLLKNPKDYSEDVQQLRQVYGYYANLAEKTKDNSKLVQFIKFMADHIDAVVQGGSQYNYPAAMS
jgi:hypothetical protein